MSAPTRWHASPGLGFGAGGAVAVAALGLLASRPDVVAVGLPLALWALLSVRRPRASAPRIDARVEGVAEAAVVRGAVEVSAEAQFVQLAVSQGGRRRIEIAVPGRGARVRTRTRVLHSGPLEVFGAVARMAHADGAWTSSSTPGPSVIWNVVPMARPLGELPLAPRLTGLHGAHESMRPGQGGDFRDIRPFASGDELRRVDWRATARLARRPGELLVRRTNALSDASVVIALDTAEDLGTVVATWQTGELDRSGPTSLDRAREAARSIATAAIDHGDRVALHELVPGGRSLRSGGGRRQLVRIVAMLAAAAADPASGVFRYRRTPPVPPGSVIYVLSTFVDGAAAQLATMWRAGGHRVVAIDTLPRPDTERLTPEQRVALRILLRERGEVFRDLQTAGVDLVVWGGDAAEARGELRAAARTRR